MGRSRTVARIVADSSPSSSSSSPSSSAESSFRELDDVFLQTQTRIWLGEVLHTRLDDQLTISDLLADGELLFEVSKIVWTMLLAKCKELRHIKGHKYKPVGSRTSSGRYRPYSNVDSFLKDESKHENVDNLSEVSGGRKHKSARLPHGKPHRKPLLRTVVEGTTLFGILCLLLHLRSKSGREKTGEVRKRSSHVQKANGMEFTSWKERNGGRVNGIYPAEKLY